ncbi:MAG: hypothetical protein ACJASL_001177 [Paraglaciecola sp.]|jgi:hypothetical protein
MLMKNYKSLSSLEVGRTKMKGLLKKLVLLLPLKLQIFLNFKVRIGYFPKLSKPRSFNEKIQHRKLYDDNPLFSICSDKFEVRNYVESKIGEEYLIPLLFVGDEISEQELRNLQGNYVVKATHDQGSVFLKKDDDTPNFSSVASQFNKALQCDFGRFSGEPWYSKIPPRIIVEEFISNDTNERPRDYKFHVFKNEDGFVTYLAVDFDRGDGMTRNFYDRNGTRLPFGCNHPTNEKSIDEVKNLQKMFDLAEELASDFDYVRVDFYNVDGKIYFGELTFAPQSGFNLFYPPLYDFEFGSHWQLS